MEDKKQIKKNLLMYPLGTVGRDMVYALFANFLLTFVLIICRVRCPLCPGHTA